MDRLLINAIGLTLFLLAVNSPCTLAKRDSDEPPRQIYASAFSASEGAL
jgi:hypothetical protein